MPVPKHKLLQVQTTSPFWICKRSQVEREKPATFICQRSFGIWFGSINGGGKDGKEIRERESSRSERIRRDNVPVGLRVVRKLRVTNEGKLQSKLMTGGWRH